MPSSSILNVVAGFLVIMLLAGMIFFRIKIGRVGSRNRISAAYRRNNLVIAVIVLYFFLFLCSPFLRGGSENGGITGWKAIFAGITALVGIASVILILYGSFKKKR